MPHLPGNTASPPNHVQRMMAGMAARAATGASGDGCCAPVPTLVTAPNAASRARRSRLSDLDPHVHCSIIGTCLSTMELRKLVPRYAVLLDRKTASDLDIHHAAVELSTAGGAAVKELNKALDTRHALTVRRFKNAADDAALRALWQAALANGDVAGAYWAVMTHPAGGVALRGLAFGDVHMLSHLVGASNRADIRRLAALEKENDALKEQGGRQQARQHEMSAHHEHVVRQLEQQVAQLTGRRGQQLAAVGAADELARLRDTLADGARQIALHTARRSDAEQKLQQQEDALQTLRAAQQRMQEDADAARAEIEALEQALERALAQSQQPGASASALPRLNGICVVYVGGRPSSSTMLGQMVAAAGGELLVHDGGIEDRRGLLAAMLPRAQMVVFPVDCISHNAMHVTRQACAWLGIACHPLRTASVASFVELMRRLGVAAASAA
ncbi:DUF2325 domain-containing protein [Rugamonas sp.]|uniref:DUF2325 domain-containing protein n=1 Tax=Rugamonas sp. TaxID=1926287 RepID=UPI0025F6B12A|nr:DUF2325 domain-containing protein [Rugamonas sp.]